MSESEFFAPDQLAIITYPHPTLRHVAKPVKRVDTLLRQIDRDLPNLLTWE